MHTEQLKQKLQGEKEKDLIGTGGFSHREGGISLCPRGLRVLARGGMGESWAGGEGRGI